jgi:hypothetical protein
MLVNMNCTVNLNHQHPGAVERRWEKLQNMVNASIFDILVSLHSP